MLAIASRGALSSSHTHTYLHTHTKHKIHTHTYTETITQTQTISQKHTEKTGIVSRWFTSYRIQCRLKYLVCKHLLYETYIVLNTQRQKHKQTHKKHTVRDEGLPVIASSAALSGHRDKGHAFVGLSCCSRQVRTASCFFLDNTSRFFIKYFSTAGTFNQYGVKELSTNYVT